jgi:hypothetical protein
VAGNDGRVYMAQVHDDRPGWQGWWQVIGAIPSVVPLWPPSEHPECQGLRQRAKAQQQTISSIQQMLSKASAQERPELLAQMREAQGALRDTQQQLRALACR